MSMIFRVGALLLVATLCNGPASGEGSDQPNGETGTNAATVWAAQQYEAVAVKVLGSPVSADAMQLDTSWVVTFRVRPANDVDPEVQVSLTKLGTGEVTAVVAKLRSSLQLQLQNLYREHKGS